jgi:predicted ATPase
MTSHSSLSTTQERYAIRGEIGRGSMGVVYEAVDRLSGATVALKRVTSAPARADLDATPDLLDFKVALTNEFRTLASLRHPHIISVLDYGFDDADQPYFTMERLDGACTLLEVAAGLNQIEVVNCLIPVLQALDYLHRRRIIHCDLKPENVLQDARGIIKLLDFGLASQFDQTGGMAGSLPYMAPEILAQQPTSEATDLYAVGVLAYQMLTGAHPFPGQDVNSLIRHILGTPPDMTPVMEQTGNLALVNVIRRLLAKDPGDRYASAQAVIVDLCHAVGQPVPPETSAIRESYLRAAQFVGREPELRILTTALDAMRSHHGSAWLVGGESGIGKSRLLEELRIRALVNGITVLGGQAVEGGGLPYQLWRDVLRPVVLAVPVTPAECGILRAVVPDIETLTGVPAHDPAPLAPDAEQRRLILAIGDVFRRWERPVLLLVEDLHWSQESLAVLKHLCKIAPELQLMIVGSYRTDEAPHLHEQLQEMALLKLERLSDDAINALGQSMLGAVAQRPTIAALLRDQSEGNALFAVEIARTLAENAGRLDQIGRMTLPDTVVSREIVAMIQRRVDRLPHEHIPLLRLAAIAGRELDDELLALITHGQGYESWLWACAEASIFEVAQGRWRFSHDRIRDAVLASIAAGEVRQLYTTVASAVEQLHADNPDYDISLLELWRKAGDLEKTGVYAERAARQALYVGEFNSAQRFLEEALSILPPDDADRPSLLVHLARVHINRTDYALAEPLLDEAFVASQAAGDLAVQSDIETERGRMAHLRSDYDGAIAYGKSAVALAQQLGDLEREAQGLAMIGVGHTRKGEMDEAGELFERGLELARTLGDQALIVKMLRNKTAVPYFQGRYEEVFTALQDILMLGQELMDHEIILTSVGNLSLMAWQMGRLDEAVAYAEQNLKASLATGERWSVVQIRNLLGFIYLDKQDTDSARVYLTHALRDSAAIQAHSVALDTLAGFARLAIAEGDDARAVRLLGLALAHPASSNEVRMTIEPVLENLRQRLDDATVEAGLAAGGTLSLDEIVSELT